MSYSAIVLLFSAVISTLNAADADEFSSHWEYKVEKSTSGESLTTSTRYSLLVANPGTPKETRVEVKSACRKGEGEAVYGDCTHSLIVSPGGRRLELKGGEDIGLAYLGGFNGAIEPVLASLAYGCCGGPSTVAFYSLDGARLGYLQTFQELHPIMDGTWDFQNVADHRSAMLIDNDPSANPSELKYIVQTLDGRRYQKEPVKVVIKEPGACGATNWVIKSFDKYADLPKPMLSLSAYECDELVREGPCERKDRAWTCTLAPKQP